MVAEPTTLRRYYSLNRELEPAADEAPAESRQTRAVSFYPAAPAKTAGEQTPQGRRPAACRANTDTMATREPRPRRRSLPTPTTPTDRQKRGSWWKKRRRRAEQQRRAHGLAADGAAPAADVPASPAATPVSDPQDGATPHGGTDLEHPVAEPRAPAELAPPRHQLQLKPTGAGVVLLGVERPEELVAWRRALGSAIARHAVAAASPHVSASPDSPRRQRLGEAAGALHCRDLHPEGAAGRDHGPLAELVIDNYFI